VDLQPASLALGQGQQVAQLGVQQHRRAPHPADQLFVAGEGARMAHLDHVERGDDSLEGRAELVADLGEKGAAGDGELAGRERGRALLFDCPDGMNPADEGGEAKRPEGDHGQVGQAELRVRSPEAAREQQKGCQERRGPREVHRPDPVADAGADDHDQQNGLRKNVSGSERTPTR
jgi:hypothetical protein